MTMPALIEQHKKTVLVTRLKKVYSTISNALVLSEAENGFIREWDLGTDYNKANLKRVVDKYFVPYLKVIETLETNISSSYNSYGFILADGTALKFSLDGDISSGVAPTNIIIFVDFRGGNTSNTDFSRDNFEMEISQKIGKLRFFTWSATTGPYASNYTRNDLINHAQYGCSKSISKGNRFNCGALIQYDGWQIKSDYPC